MVTIEFVMVEYDESLRAPLCGKCSVCGVGTIVSPTHGRREEDFYIDRCHRTGSEMLCLHGPLE